MFWGAQAPVPLRPNINITFQFQSARGTKAANLSQKRSTVAMRYFYVYFYV